MAMLLCAAVFIAAPAHNFTGVAFAAESAGAEPQWKLEFRDICSKTDASMDLTVQELKALIERCDRLKPVIDKLEGAEGKVYSKRLKMCRDLFEYVLQSKEKEGPAK